MKVIFQILTEPGDTPDSIIRDLKEEFGGAFTEQTLWDFNRGVMPTPQHFPAAGTMLRVPVDPSTRSGGPEFDTLHNKILTDDELRASSAVLGGLRTPSTPGGEPDALQPTKDDGFTA